MAKLIMNAACVLAAVLQGAAAMAQVLDTLPVQRPNQVEGTHFLVAYMQNEITIPPSGLRLRLLIASAYPNTVTIIYPDGQQRQYQLRALETLPLLLPDTLEVRHSELPLRRAIEIRAELPVSVFAMSSQYTSSDSYTALPVEMWGTAYTVLSLPNDTYGDGPGTLVDPLDIRQSEFMIIAKDNNTRVQFFPTVLTEGGRQAKQWHEVVLQRGECFLVKSSPQQQGQGDLTGTLIRSDKPIAVLSGHVRASVPIGLPAMLDSKDHLVEMLLPDNLLGSSYVTTPFATGGRIPAGDYLRAVALHADTRITIYTEREDIVHVLANPGDTLTLPRVNSPTWWYGTKPFALAQYMTTGTVANSIMFDPAMVIATPIGRYVSRAIFQAPANLSDATFARQFDRHWLNVICDERARLSLKLDGKLVAATVAPELATQKFRSSGMFWAQIPVTPGIHVLEADSGLFTGVLYGMGYTDSYAHPIGITSFVGRDTVVPTLAVRDSCAWLLGDATDHGGAGLAYVTVDPDSTRNYTFSVEPKQDGITFRAAIIDPLVDGTIAVIVRDRAGNGVRYRYRYTAPVIDLTPKLLRFSVSSSGSVVCQEAVIRNFSFSDTLVIVSVRFARDGQGVFQVQNLVAPFVCPPRREAKVRLCFGALQEGTFRDTLLWDLGCGRVYRQPIIAIVSRPALSIADVDFGDVVVGDTICREFRIVNSGTEAVVLTSIGVDSSGTFAVSAMSLPHLLQPGDTLKVIACFLPRDTGYAQAEIAIGNDKGLDAWAVFRGRGIKAILVTETLDCGKRRVGARFDTVAYIYNHGTANGIVRYRGQIGDVTAFLHSLRINERLVVPRGGSTGIPLQFSPPVVGPLASSLEFTTDDGQVIAIPITGFGTLPIPVMSDTIVGPVKVGEEKTYSILVLRSEGNESLTVDSLWIDGPDKSSFRIETVRQYPLVVPPGERIELPITFLPRRGGMHEVFISVQHDAGPNYVRRISSSKLAAIAVEPDSSGGGGSTDTTSTGNMLGFRLAVEYNATPHRCSELPITITAVNIGNTILRITGAELIDKGGIINVLQRFPDRLFPGQLVQIKITLPPPQQKRDVTLRVIANDTIIRQQIIHVDPLSSATTLAIDNLVGNIDSIVTLVVRGSIAGGYHAIARARLDVNLPGWITEYRGGSQINVLLQSDGRRSGTNASVSMDHDMLQLEWELPAFSSSCQWEIGIPLRLLYSPESVGQVVATFSAGDCFQDGSTQAIVATYRVCGHNLRAIQLSGIALRNISPNPIDGTIRIELDVYVPQAVHLWAYDINGQRISLGNTSRLNVGHRVVIFDAEQLPSGWYALMIETSDGRQYSDCCYLKQ